MDLKEHVADFTLLRARIDFATARYSNAADNYEAFIDLNDSLVNAENHARIIEMETQYQTRQKDLQNELLKTENDAYQSEIAYQKSMQYLYWALIGLLVLAISFAVVTIYITRRSRSKLQVQYELVNERNEKIRTLLREIHHNVKNNLATIKEPD